MVYWPKGKDIMPSMKRRYTIMVYSPNEREMVLWKVAFRSGNCHGKRLKKYSIKDATSIKINFMHYMKWTRVMLPVVFKEFEIIYIFLTLFSFHCHYELVKGQL